MTTQTDVENYCNTVFKKDTKPNIERQKKQSKIFQKKRFSEYLDRRLGSDGSVALNASEKELIRFIANRTVDFDKTSERIPIKHFTEGVYCSTGELLQQPLSFTERTIRSVIKRLEKEKLVCIKHHANGNEYSLNFQHVAFEQFFKENAVNLGSVENAQPDVQNLHSSYTYNNHTEKTRQMFHSEAVKETDKASSFLENRESGKNQENKSDLCENNVSAQNRETITLSIADFSANFDETQAKRLARMKAKNNVTLVFIQEAWASSMGTTNYTNRHIVATLSRKELGMAKQGLQRDLKRDFIDLNNAEGIPTFFNFCINNWGLIVRAKFGWMTKNAPPHEPDFAFFVKFRKQFFEAYHQEYSLLKYTGGTFRANLVSTLIKKGFSEKEATEEARIQEELGKLQAALRSKTAALEQAKHEVIKAKHLAMDEAQKEADDYSSYIHKKIFGDLQEAFLIKMRAKSIERPNMSFAESQKEMQDMLREMLGDDYVE